MSDATIATASLPTLLARIDKHHVLSVQIDMLCLVRLLISKQLDAPVRWLTEDVLQFGDTGISVNLEAGIPTLTLSDGRVVALSGPVTVPIGRHSVHLDLMTEVQRSWKWLQWNRSDRASWKQQGS